MSRLPPGPITWPGRKITAGKPLSLAAEVVLYEMTHRPADDPEEIHAVGGYSTLGAVGG